MHISSLQSITREAEKTFLVPGTGSRKRGECIRARPEGFEPPAFGSEKHPVEDRALRMVRTIDSRNIGKADSKFVPGEAEEAECLISQRTVILPMALNDLADGKTVEILDLLS
jgi:hypothetical protein